MFLCTDFNKFVTRFFVFTVGVTANAGAAVMDGASSASIINIINEAGGTSNNVATGETWDKINFAPDSEASEVQKVLNELSQHDERGYVKALTDLAPTDSMVHVAVSQDLNNLIGDGIYSIKGKKMYRLGFETGIGVGVTIKRWDLSAEYDCSARKDYLSHTETFNIKYNF